MIADLVPADALLNAISLNAVQFNLARVVGPACAGLVIAWLNTAACFYINAVSFVALIAALAVIRVAPRHPLPAQSIWRHLGEGIQYVRAQPTLLLILTTATTLSLFCLPYTALMPVFARDVLRVGPDGLGYLMASAGAGAVIGALGLAAFGNVPDRMPLALRAGLLLAAAVVAFALSRNLYLSFAMLLLAGGSMVVCGASLNTSLQLAVDPVMRGRVLSMYLLAIIGFNPVGSLQVGTLAQFVGAPRAVALSGTIAFAFLALALTRNRSARQRSGHGGSE
jgi:MFS family permease